MKTCAVFVVIHVAEHFIPNKTRTASLFYGFKNESFRKFIDVKILKIDLVWAVKSRKKFIENGKRVKHVQYFFCFIFMNY